MELIIIKAIAILIIFIIIRQKQHYNDFRVSVLFSLLLILVAYYMLGFIVTKYYSFDSNGYFWFSRMYNVVLTTLFIIVILLYSPIRYSQGRILCFPLIKIGSPLYGIIIIYFVILSIFIYHQVGQNPEKILKYNYLILYQINNTHYSALLLYVITELYGVIGEELVFRYFTINTMRSFKLNTSMIIIISSCLWTLMHEPLSINHFFLGLLLAYCYIATGYLSISIFLHFMYNIVATTQSVYIYLLNTEVLKITSLQYASIILVILIAFYHLFEWMLRCKDESQMRE